MAPCKKLNLRSIELTINLFSESYRSGDNHFLFFSLHLREQFAERTSFAKFRGDWRVSNGRLPINPSWRFQRFPVTIAARGTSTRSEANVFERSVTSSRWTHDTAGGEGGGRKPESAATIPTNLHL